MARVLLVGVVAYALLVALAIIALVTDRAVAVVPATVLGYPWSRIVLQASGLADRNTALTSVALSLPMVVNLTILVVLHRAIARRSA